MAADHTHQEIIDACDNAVYALVTQGVASYTWLGRTVTKRNLAEIHETRRVYVALRDEDSSGAAGGTALGVFGDPR